MAGHGSQFFIVSDEDMSERRSQYLCEQHQHHSADSNHRQAHPQQIFKLVMITGSKMVTDDGRASDGISQKDSDKNKIYIHNRAVRRDPVFSCN